MNSVLIIDNYDSFVHNLARYVEELGWRTMVRRNDKITLDEISAQRPSHIIISPGPRTPKEAGLSNKIIERMGKKIPILGVCLGHQCIGEVYGGVVKKARQPMHGKTSTIRHTNTNVFKGLKIPLRVTRYHSLIVEKETLPDSLEILSETDEGEIMAFAHKTDPVVGVQFHPEAVLTQGGHKLIENFLGG